MLFTRFSFLDRNSLKNNMHPSRARAGDTIVVCYSFGHCSAKMSSVEQRLGSAGCFYCCCVPSQQCDCSRMFQVNERSTSKIRRYQMYGLFLTPNTVTFGALTAQLASEYLLGLGGFGRSVLSFSWSIP